jgi:hypothetical protein
VALDPKQAGELLKANIKNLNRKLESGKTLTPSEVNLLESIKSGGEANSQTHAGDQAELAKLLGVNRKTIQRAIKTGESPGSKANGTYEIAAWRAYFASRGTIDDTEGLSQTQLKARQILLQNSKLEYQIAVLKREYMPTADVEKWGGELAAAIRKIIVQIHLVAPSVVGCSVPDAEARLKDLEDDILNQLHSIKDNMEKWKNEPTS